MSSNNFKQNFLSLLSLFLGTGVGALSIFMTSIVLARNTNPEVFGNYSAIYVTVTTLAPLCGFGISQYWLKIFGQHGAYGLVWIRSSISFVLISTSLVFIVLITWFVITLETSYLKIVAIILTFVILKTLVTELLNTTLQIEGQYLFLSIWHFFQASILLIALIGLIYLSDITLNELSISIIQFSVTIFLIVIATPIIYAFIKKKTTQINKQTLNEYYQKYQPNILNTAKEAAPFGVAGLFYLIYYQLGVVFIRYILGAEAAGYYSVAFTFLSAALLVPGIIYQKFLLPKLHRWAYHDREKFIQSYHYGNYIMLFLGIIGAITLWFLAPYLIQWFFGAQYATAIALVQLMALNIPIVYVASSAGSLLVTQDHMKTKVYYMGASALISLLLSAPMILYFRTKGAIYTNIICNILLLILYFRAVRKRVL